MAWSVAAPMSCSPTNLVLMSSMASIIPRPSAPRITRRVSTPPARVSATASRTAARRWTAENRLFFMGSQVLSKIRGMGALRPPSLAVQL